MKASRSVFVFACSLVLLAALPGVGYAAFWNDPYHLPMTPLPDYWGHDPWYDRSTPTGDRAAIALRVDPSQGARYTEVVNHLAAGKRVVILIGGYGSWGSPSAFERGAVTYVNDYLDAVVLVINYSDWLQTDYAHSFNRGVDMAFQFALKARNAGAGAVRIYGHSQGSDVAARVVNIFVSATGLRVQAQTFPFSYWYGQGNPSWFEGALGFGNPAGIGVTSAAAPPADANGKRGGFYRYTNKYNGYYFANKLVLFNRTNDGATCGGFSDFVYLGTAAHDYTGVLSHPEFMAIFNDILTNPAGTPPNQPPASGFDGGYFDRASGVTWDFTDVHFLPFIPSASEVGTSTIRFSAQPATNAIPSVSEAPHVHIKFYDALNGGLLGESSFDMNENGALEMNDPYPTVDKSAIVTSSEQLAVVVSYSHDDSQSAYFATYPAERFPAMTTYAPFLTETWPAGRDLRQTTEIVLFNPRSVAASVSITYRNETTDSAYLGETYVTSYSIPAGAAIAVSSSELPDYWQSTTNLGTVASARISTGAPVAGMVRNKILGNTPSGWVQFQESNYRLASTAGSVQEFAPYLLSHSTGNADLVIYNPGPSAMTYSVSYYQEGGGNVGRITTASVPAESAIVLSTATVMQGFGVGVFEGNAIVTATASPGKSVLVAQVATTVGIELYEGFPEGAQWYTKTPNTLQIPLLGHATLSSAHVTNVANKSGTSGQATLRFFNDAGTDLGAWPAVTVQPWSSKKQVSSPAAASYSARLDGTGEKKLGVTVQNEIQGITKPPVNGYDYVDRFMGYCPWF